VAAHGLRGWVRVQSYTDPPDSLLQYREWHLRKAQAGNGEPEQALQVLQSQFDGRNMRVALSGLNDRSAAEALRDYEIVIERAALPAVAGREYYRDDLLGFAVRNSDGELLGTLQHFLAAPSVTLMVVRGEREYAVPAGPPHLKRVDLERREIEVDWPADF
jgi:16S rRNA processing protein RimM